MYRRTYLQSIGGLAALPVPTGQEGGPCDCDFCGTVEESEDEAGLAGEPDFTVSSSEKEHRVYWRPESHFSERFSPLTFGYASVGGDYLVLNSDLSNAIDSTIVAHEVGHNLGYRHVEDSLMAPSLGGMADRDPDRPLASVTREVFKSIDSVALTDWDHSDVTRLIAAYNDGPVTLDAALYGIARYNEGAGPDAYYRSGWDGFGEKRGVSLAGRFYRQR